MITLFSILFSLITMITPIVSGNTNTFAVSNKNVIATSNTIVDGFNNLEFNNNEHYLGLDNATHIALTQNNLFYSTENKVFNYNLQDKSITEIDTISNVSEIKATSTNLFIQSNNVLYIVDLSNNTKTQLFDANMFNVFEENNIVYLSYILDNTFTLCSITNNSSTTIFTLELSSSFTPISITNNLTNSYVVIKQNNISKMIIILKN